MKRITMSYHLIKPISLSWRYLVRMNTNGVLHPQVLEKLVNQESWPDNGFQESKHTYPEGGCGGDKIDSGSDEAKTIHGSTGTGFRTIFFHGDQIFGLFNLCQYHNIVLSILFGTFRTGSIPHIGLADIYAF